jgi:Na+/proline symporter
VSGPAAGTRDRDPGLQPERTRLAWRRTTLSGTVAAGLAGWAALAGGVSAGGILACALCGVCWLVLLRLAHRRIRALAVTGAPGTLARRYATAAVVCTAVMAACGAVLVVPA